MLFVSHNGNQAVVIGENCGLRVGPAGERYCVRFTSPSGHVTVLDTVQTQEEAMDLLHEIVLAYAAGCKILDLHRGRRQ